MNNGYEHMEEKTQDGVCFQWDESHEDILDMNVEAGIKVVALPSSVRMSKTEKMFPDVEELVIANNVKNILIPNTLFPNVKKVTSRSPYFISGRYIFKRYVGRYKKLLNVFCTSDDINLKYDSTLEKPSAIADYAFAGSKSTVLLGTDSISSCDEFAFKDSAFENQPFVNGVKETGGIVFDIDYDADEVVLPDDEKTLQAYANNIDLSKVKKLVIHNAYSLNYFMTSKIPPVIVVDSNNIYLDDMVTIVHSSRGDSVVKDVQLTDKVKKTYIPKNVKPSMFDTLKSRASFFWSDEGEETCGFWDCSYSAKGREDEALAEYLEFGFIDAKEYLKKNSKRIITRLVEEGDEDKIVQFLNLGFVSKPTLKSLIPKAEEKELTIVSSYILKQIGDKKTSNRFAL